MIAQYNTLLHSDIKSIYDSFNTFISRYGGTITQFYAADSANTPRIPAENAPVQATDINNLDSKIQEFQEDTYLKTEPTFWKNVTVSAGTIIYAGNMTNITTTSVQSENSKNYL